MEYHMVRRFGKDRQGRPKPCPRWIPLALEVIDAEAYWKPPDDALGRPGPSGTELTRGRRSRMPGSLLAAERETSAPA